MKEYKSKLEEYIKSINDLNLLEIDEDRLEFYFESFRDWSVFHTQKEIEKWIMKLCGDNYWYD